MRLEADEIKTQMSSSNTNPVKKSLFAQSLEKKGKLKAFHELNTQNQNQNSKVAYRGATEEFPKSKILTGEGLTGASDVERIHEENVEKLSKMSKEEILKEQERLLEMLDPKIISFIRKRGVNKEEEVNKMDTTTERPSTSNVPVKEKKVKFDDLPLKPDKKWLNMNKIEYEKLAWMTDLPDAMSSTVGDLAPARFDFNGNLLNPKENLPPVTTALYHHGDEPNMPGYTLQELYQLTRSNFTQQRLIALKTISNIIKNCHLNVYTNQLKEPLLPQLIDSGIIFLLRWCLDDQSESIISVCLEAFLHLLQPSNQESYLDKLTYAYNGHLNSSLYPFVSEDKATLDELSDLEYLKVDTIKALFRMNFINRLRYLLFTYKLKSKPIFDIIFQILYRIERHSLESCYELCEKYDLINDTIKTFIKGPAEEEEALAENINMDKVFKLIRLACQAGRTLATNIYKNHDFKTVIIKHLTVSNDATKVELINLIKVFSIYQLTDDLVTDFYECLLKQLNGLVKESGSGSVDLLRSYFSLFDYLLRVNTNKTINRVLFDSVSSIVITFIKENYFKIDNLNLFSTCFHYLNSYFSTYRSNSNETSVLFNQLEQIEFIFNEIISKSINNEFQFDKITSKLSECSLTLNEANVEEIRSLNSNNLKHLPTMLFPLKDYLPDADGASSMWPFDYLIALVRLMLTSLRIKRDLDKRFVIVKKFLFNNYVKNYLKKAFIVPADKPPQASYDCSHLAKYETYFAYYCVKLALVMFNYDEAASLNDTQNSVNYHLISLNLMVKFKNGDEHYVHDLLCNALFNMNLWSHLNNSNTDGHGNSTGSLIKRFQNIKLNNSTQTSSSNKYLRTLTGDIIKSNYDIKEFEQKLYDNLNLIKFTYLNNIFKANSQIKYDLERSQRLVELNNLDRVQTLLTSKYKETMLFNTEWIYIPIIMLQQQQQQQQQQGQSGANEQVQINANDQIDIIVNCLKYLFICELYRQDYMKQIAFIARYSRLLSVFLTDSQIFLDSNISLYLYLILLNYIDTNEITNLSFEYKIPGIISFYDYFQHLLQNYDSVSFGDPLYALYLLLPVQQYCPSRYKQLLWSDYLHVFRFIRFNLQQEFVLPIENFLKPFEDDIHILTLYAQALLSNQTFDFICKSQIAYSIAINHLNSYLFEQKFNENELDYKKNLFKQFYFTTNEVISNGYF